MFGHVRQKRFRNCYGGKQPQLFRIRYSCGMNRSVSEYSAEAHLSERRVRKMAEVGLIAASKVGGTWIIEEPLPDQDQPRRRGRPLSEASAWNLGLMVEGYSPISPRPSRTHDRIQRLRTDAELRAHLSAWFQHRGDTRYFRAQPADLADLRTDPLLKATGVSHPDSQLLRGQEHEAYVLDTHLQRIIEDYLLIPSARSRANVVLRVTSQPVALRLIPRLLVAADLQDRGGARERAASQQIMDMIL